MYWPSAKNMRRGAWCGSAAVAKGGVEVARDVHDDIRMQEIAVRARHDE